MDRQRFLALALCVILLLSSGCQPTPDKASVVRRDPDALYASGGTVSASAEKTISVNESFASTNGRVRYTLALDNVSVPPAALPVLRVTPEPITAESAKRIAEVLFDGSPMYEPSQLTRAEIAEKIAELERSLEEEALRQEANGVEKDMKTLRRARQEQLAYYESIYGSAPESSVRTPCQWSFFPTTHYIPDWVDGDESIMASAEIRGIPYRFWVLNRDASDYRVHSIYCSDASGSMEIYNSLGYPEPLEDAAQQELKACAAEWIDRMGVGEWVIDYCRQRQIGALDANGASAESRYIYQVHASRIYGGTPVVWQPQLGNLKTGDAYASNYYYEEIVFEFGYDRQLVSFRYEAPERVTETVNEAAPIFPLEEILERVRDHLTLRDTFAYYASYDADHVDVNITELSVGLTRTRIPGSADDFYLLPAVTVRGSYSVYDAAGKPIAGSDYPAPALTDYTFLVMNVTDGSVINTELGY